MRTILDEKHIEIVIEKSNFFGVVFHLEDETLFKEKLKEIIKQYPGATHYCYGYKIGNKQKSNDDGEPSSTAGKPILETIINNNIDNVAVIVVRYFGGIKLGAGGLTRAYANTANQAIKESIINEIVETQVYELEYEYNLNDIIKRYLDSNNIKILYINYDVKVKTSIATNLSLDQLINLANGNILINKKEKVNLII